MSHDPTSMNRAELQAYVAELLAAHDMHGDVIAKLRADLAAAKEREAALVEGLRDARKFVQAKLDVCADSFCVKGPDGKPDWSTLDESDGGACGEAIDFLARIDAALKETTP